MFDTIVAGLCHTIGLEPPAEGADGAFFLQVNALEIGILEEPDHESLVLQCIVGSLGADTRPGVYAEICEANFHWSATLGATLGFNSATGDVALVREWALAGLDAGKLASMLQDFIVAAEFWRDRLAGGEAAPAPASAASLDALSTNIRA